jgi:drug/metabolite transporter (DMT)-like permease
MNKGKLFIIIAAVIIGLTSLLIRHLTINMGIDVLLIVFFRSGVSLILLFSLTLIKREPLLGKNKSGLILRGITGSIAMILSFSAIAKTYMSNAMVLLYTFPIFATLIAIMLKRDNPKGKIILLLLSFIGILLIIKPRVGGLNIGDIMGLVSGIFAGIAIFMVRELRKTDTPLNIAKYLALISLIIVSPYTLSRWTKLTVDGLLILLLIGIAATVGQYYMAAGYRYCTNAEGGTLSYITVLVAGSGAFVFFAEFPDLADIFGGLLVILSSILLISSNKILKPRV